MSWRAAAPNPRDDASPWPERTAAPRRERGTALLDQVGILLGGHERAEFAGSASLISIIQLACGSAFTFSGFSASAPLTAVTTPDTGL